MNTFSIRETFDFAWRAFKKYPWDHALIALIFLALGLLGHLKMPILSLLVFVVLFIAKLGYVRIALRSVEGAKPNNDLTNTLMGEKKKFWRLLGGSIVIALGAAAPMIITGVLIGLLLVPVFGGINPYMLFTNWIGVVLAVLLVASVVFYITVIIRYAFFIFVLVEKDLGIKASLAESARLTKGIAWKYFCFLFITGIVLIPCAITGIGLLFGIPFAMLSQAYVYRKLQGTTPTLGTAVEIAPEIHPMVEPETAVS